MIVMTSRAKTSNRNSSASPKIFPSDGFKPLFEDFLDGSVNNKVDPTACIQFATIREPCISGVDRFVYNFDNQEMKENEILTSGYIVGSKLSVVVPLVGSNFSYVIRYLKDTLQVSDEEAYIAAGQHEVWYGIVDGTHTNYAIRKLRLENPRWSNFK